MPKYETDICIIGSGVAGAIIAQECLDAGREVLMLEAGGRANGRALGLRFLEQILRDYRYPRSKLWHRGRNYRKTDYQSAGYPLKGRALIVRGGSALNWTGDAFRMRPEDFELESRTGIGFDWPIGYDDLEPHYTKGEKTIRVAGNHLDGGHPPRNIPFPIKPKSFPVRDQSFINLFSKKNWSLMHHNISLASDGSIFTADELVDKLENYKNFKLILHKVATRIICASKRRATSVEYWDSQTDETFIVDAQTIVVCAGGIETPNLLLQSKNKWWPEGLGNHNDHLGRHLISHGGVAIGGRPNGLRLINGPIGPTVASREFDTAKFQKEGKFLLIWRPAPSGYLFLNAIFEQFPSDSNTVSPGSTKTKFGTKKPIINFDKDERFIYREQMIREQLENLIKEMGFNISLERSYSLAHPMCTARMSHNPADGVIDANLKIHSMDNVYVCGSASFTSGGAANPTMTIVALAHRLGAYLINNG